MLYLASTSPRRRQLLRGAGLRFRPVPPGVEPAGSGTPAERAVLRAVDKACGALVDGAPGLVLGVDTVVELDGEELGKPVSVEDAEQMLCALSGRDHAVHTALCLRCHPPAARWTALSSAVVRCRLIGRHELRAYLAAGEWRGKAGGYGIQGRAAAFMALRSGELDTVIGLPVAQLRRLLQEVDVDACDR